jgi:uncharacterized membrane protein YhaH (DUF805 family)
MTFPLSFSGKVGRVPYLLWSVAAFFSQHLFVWLVLRPSGGRIETDYGFWVAPLRTLATQAHASDVILVVGFAYFLIVAWVLAVLAFRRAHDADLSEALALWAGAPIVQIPMILFLAGAPPRAPGEERAPSDDLAAKDYSAAVLGVVAAIGVTLAAVAVSTLAFRSYGYGLFVVSPFLIGATTGYLANRKIDIGGSATTKLVIAATALGGAGLIVAALEGIFCIVLASPLVGGIAIVGGLLGRAIARAGKHPTRHVAPAFAVLPVVLALEYLFVPTTSFDTIQSIAINVPAEAVWRAVLHMDRIDGPLALPFRFGVAYPIRGEVIGEGVGAVRHGEFSTGTAIERVTEWVPNRKLAFTVETDIPAMRELSPYEHVHAPHVIGYFTTRTTSFELTPRGDGGIEVTLRSAHEIRLDPLLYWMPFARWMVAENNARVLAHIRRQAERNVRAEN